MRQLPRVDADTVTSNHVPWIETGICFLSCIVLFFSIRVLLARENRRHDAADAEPPDNPNDAVTSRGSARWDS